MNFEDDPAQRSKIRRTLPKVLMFLPYLATISYDDCFKQKSDFPLKYCYFDKVTKEII